MRLSQRMEKLEPYLFVEINNRIAEKKAKGEEVISFAIGDPDMPTPEHIINRLCREAREPANHRYGDCRAATAMPGDYRLVPAAFRRVAGRR